MKKICTVEDLCCAHCAMKIEKEIAALPGVSAARVNFLSGRVTIEAEDEQMDAVLREAQKICRRIEPDCRLIIK